MGDLSRIGVAIDSDLLRRFDYDKNATLDVYPDGRAFNLDESIQRMRYRDGYDKPLAWMESGKVYKVTLQPLTTTSTAQPMPKTRSACGRFALNQAAIAGY